MFKAKSRRGRLKIFLAVCVLILALLAAATVVTFHIYHNNLQPVSSSQSQQLITIQTGSTANQIADQLHQDNLVRAAWAFEWYVREHNAREDLKAGTYSLSPSQSVADIVAILTQGKVQTRLVTILPGKRLDQVRAALINDGFSPTAVDNALQPSQYTGLPALADKPADVSLEGLLYPDSFQKTAATDPSVIVRESLTEMGQHLTPALQSAFATEGLSTFKGIILASIVGQEASKASDQAQVAQVFLKRLNQGMMLQSDQTAFYGAILAGQPPSVNFTSVYNTYNITGLPPTPISNVNDQDLNSAAHPAATDWLYFVAGDDGTVYFEQTAQQHQADTQAYCHKLCGQ